ncbi:MAG TPA: hypothetical protein VG028_13265 [Terriglobia bacterium]|nr:hypothetical protein [Terriglobia bacterium]
MGSFFLNDKIEEALVAIITQTVPAAALAGVEVLPGKNPGIKSAPCVICFCDGDGEEDPRGSGNFWVDAGVGIKFYAVANPDGSGDEPDPKGANQALISAVFGAIWLSNLDALLSAAVADLTVFPTSVIFQAHSSGRDQDGAWIDELRFKCYCCASALPA